VRYSGRSAGDLVPPPLYVSEIQSEVHPNTALYRTIPSDDTEFVPIADPSKPKPSESVPSLEDKQIAASSQLSSSHIQFQRFGPGIPLPLFENSPSKQDSSTPQISPSSHVLELKIPKTNAAKAKLQVSQSYINERGERVHGNYRDPQQGPLHGKTPLPPIPWVDERGKNHHLLLPPGSAAPEENDESKSGEESPEHSDKQSSAFRKDIPDEPKLEHILEAEDGDEDFGPWSTKHRQPKVYDNETKSKIILSNSKIKTGSDHEESDENNPDPKQSQEASDEGEPNEGKDPNVENTHDEEGQNNSNRQPEDENRESKEDRKEPHRTNAYSEEILPNFDYWRPSSQENYFTKSTFDDDHSSNTPTTGFFANKHAEDSKNPFADPHFDIDKYIESIAIEPSVNKLIGSLAKEVEKNEQMREAKLKGDLERTKGGEISGGYEDEDRVNVATPKPPPSKFIEEPSLWGQGKDKRKGEIRGYDDKIFSLKTPFSAETHRELDFFTSGQNGKIAPSREASSRDQAKSQYSNPFADPNFDFDEYLARLQGTTTTTPKSDSDKSRKRLLKAPGYRQRYITRPRGRIKVGTKEYKGTEVDSKENEQDSTSNGRTNRPNKSTDRPQGGETKTTLENKSDQQHTAGTTRSENRATESSVFESTAPHSSESTTAFDTRPSKSPRARPFDFELSTPRPFTRIRTDGSNLVSNIHGGVPTQPGTEQTSFSAEPDQPNGKFEEAFSLDNIRGRAKQSEHRNPTQTTKNTHFDVLGFSPEYSIRNVHLAPTESYETLNPIRDIFPDDSKIGMSTETDEDHSKEDQGSEEVLSTNTKEKIVKLQESHESTSLRPWNTSAISGRIPLPTRVRSSTPKSVTLFPSLESSTVRVRLPSTAVSTRNTSRLPSVPSRSLAVEKSPIKSDSSFSETRSVLPLPFSTSTVTPTSKRAGGTGDTPDKDKSVTAGRQRYGPKTTSLKETTFLRTSTTNLPSRTGSSGRYSMRWLDAL